MNLEKLRKIVVTPAGRLRYLEILVKYLDRAHELGEFDEWHLWLNTNVKEDVDYIKSLKAKKYVKIIEIPDPFVNNKLFHRIHKFFQVDSCNPNAIYLRLDDDICWMDDRAITRLFDFRINHPEYFLVFGNIINNALCGYIHQRSGLVGTGLGFNRYKCMDAVGWNNPEYAAGVHLTFLDNIKHNEVEKYDFGQWKLLDYERFSINVMSWFGWDFMKFNGVVGIDEENWLSETKPKTMECPNCIYGGAIFSHFSFYTQREYLETKTDLLPTYKKLAENIK